MVMRHTGAAMAGLGMVALVLAGCAPASAPPAAATTQPVALSSVPGGSAPSPSASAAASAAASPSPVLTTASPQSSPAAGVSPSPSPSSAPATPMAAEQPLTPETSPAGDIPDNQVFVTFTSTSGGYQLQVPEGWARTETGSDVRFVNKLDGVQVAVTSASAVPTAASAQAAQIADLQRTGRAVQVNNVQEVQLPAGSAVMVDYSANSDPDPVTGKQVRLEENAYLLYQNGKLATLTLWAPLGSDNVDQWQQMAQSFGWL